jgi:hypothetical protein
VLECLPLHSMALSSGKVATFISYNHS